MGHAYRGPAPNREICAISLGSGNTDGGTVAQDKRLLKHTGRELYAWKAEAMEEQPARRPEARSEQAEEA